MGDPLDRRVGAKLAGLAYIPVDKVKQTSGQVFLSGQPAPSGNLSAQDIGLTPPPGWVAVTNYSSYGGGYAVASPKDDQFVVFMNQETKQVVFAIKGTDTIAQAINDVANQGYQDFVSIDQKFSTFYPSLQAALGGPSSGYSYYVVGHSLGGGIAEMLALKYGIDGFGYNSGPIAPGFASQVGGSIGQSISQYYTNGHSFLETDVEGDPVSNILAAPFYKIDNAALRIYNPYGDALAASIAIGNPLAIGYYLYQSHRVDTISSVLSDPIYNYQIGSSLSSVQYGLISSFNNPLAISAALNQDIVVTALRAKLGNIVPRAAGIPFDPAGVDLTGINPFLTGQQNGFGEDSWGFQYNPDGTITYGPLGFQGTGVGTAVSLQASPQAPAPTPDKWEITFAQLAQAFGSTLGRLIGGSNLVISTAAGSVISAVALNIGQSLFHNGAHVDATAGAAAVTGQSSVWSNFGNELGQFGVNAALGSVSSYLASELSQAVGFTGFAGKAFSAISGDVLQYYATTALAGTRIGASLGVHAASSLGNALESGIAGFIGAELASLIVQPHTVAEATLASLGSAVGSIFSTALNSALFGAKIGASLGVAGVAIGAFVGFIIGDLFGSLFGHHKPRIPTASAETVLQIPFARYGLGAEVSANGGDLSLADGMARAARDTLNGIIDQVVGDKMPSFVANGYSPTQAYGYSGSQFYVKLAGSQLNVASANEALDKGVLWALPQTLIIGGDIILKRAIINSDAISVTSLLGDLQIARDYEVYLRNAPVIDAAIASSWNNLSLTDQSFYLANSAFITRAISASELPLQSGDLGFYYANQSQVDRIVSSISVSTFAAGWIVTLSRAAELGLGQYSASDFFGGMQGFLQSFGVAGSGSSLHYEDVTASLSGGGLTLTANGAFGRGTFSLMPSASSDGTAITIASFGAQVGYVEQAIGYRSTASDIEIAAPGSGAVTVYAGSPGYGGWYYYSPGNDGGSDIIIGAGGNDYLAAGSGGDWIDGQGGDDQVYGGAGADVLLGGDGNDQIVGGTGRGYLAGGTGNDYVDGGGGADVLVGGAGSDTLHGSDGNDILIADEDGGGTYDLLDGGNGNDTVSFERFSTGVTADISAQGPSNVLTVQQAGFTLYSNQTIYSPNGQYRFIFQSDQNLVLYGPGNAVLWASNTRNGGGYRVTLNADGNLVMYKSNGSVKWQSYSGGHSGATLTLDNAGQVNIDDQDGTSYWAIGGGGYVAPVTSNIYGDQWQSIENITGSNFDDNLVGTNYGSSLKGLGGNDVLTGGAGDDVIEGGTGGDQISGGGGNNTASYTGSAGGVYVSLKSGSGIGGDATGDSFVNVQNLSGSNSGDELAGDAGANILKTGAGDDWIDATAGYDTYDGGDGYDTVDYSATTFVSGSSTFYYGGYPYTYTAPALRINLTDYGSSATYRDVDGSSAYHTLSSIEQVIGTSSDDIFSSSGTTINVTWNGGAGADDFSGGDGSDTYVFGHGFGTYTISDTSAASNTLQMTSDVTFDDLWVANAGGTLQVGIRGEAGYMSVYSNFASGNDVIKTLDLGGAGHADLTQINAVYGGSDGSEGISGNSSTSNLIFAYNGDDTIYAANGTYSYQGSVIYAGLGNDTIVTSSGDDQFLFERGNGHDYVMDSGGQNTIVFGSTIAADDVIYQIVGNDLIIGIKDLNNPDLPASQVADTIQIVGGAVKNVGTTYGTTSWNTAFSVEAGGATTDLTKANIAWVVNYVDDSGGGGYGGGYGGGWYGGGYIPPIVLDLGDDGLQITPVGQSDIVTKDAAGNVLRTSWVGPTNGILAYDRNGDGRVDNTADISFTQDKKGAKTDLEGLAGWDSNGDSVLNALDVDFAKLVVWTDANQDGQQEAGEVVSLLVAGVASIDLKGKPTGFDGKDTIDTIVRNTTSFTRLDGTTGTAYDVALARRALGDGAVSTILGAKNLGSVAAIGSLANDPLTAAKAKGLGGAALTAGVLDALADVRTGGTINAKISATAATRWASVLDPTLKAARKALLASGMQGEDLLAAVRATKAHGDDWSSLFGRGLRTAATRMQAIVIDFNRSGPDFIDPTKSRVLADVSNSGEPVQIGWLNNSDGILAYDADGNGQVSIADEIDLTGEVANAKSAFQGLGAFDTDKDGTLSAADSGFARFLIWRDRNSDGRSDAGEVQSLAQAGVAKFDLTGSASRSAFGSGSANEVLGVGKVVFTDGSTRATYDVALGFADADTSADPTPSPTPKAKVSVISTMSGADDGSGATGEPVASDVSASNGLAGVGRSRGSLSGPTGDVVAADAAQTALREWWRDPATVGELASLASPQLTSDRELGANRSSLASIPGDAAQMQRLLLLRQNMASMRGDAGGAAAVWNRGAANDTALAIPAGTATPSLPSAFARAG